MQEILTNEYNECLESFLFVSEIMDRIPQKPHTWKWVVISFHNAIQGILVLSLQGSNGLLALTDKSAKEWMDSYQHNKPYKKENIDSFLNLYDKIKSDRHLSTIGSKSFTPPGDQDWSMKKLNSLRNEFIHFSPKFWSLDLNGLPKIITDCLALARFQCLESNTIHFSRSRPVQPIIYQIEKQTEFFNQLGILK